ncbi:acyl-CoA carboxylase epsilon subunit [Streptomyces sp. NPDC001537]
MGDTDRGELALRVERGTATAAELAALTVVLLALRRRPAAQPGGNTKPVGLFAADSEVPFGRFLPEGGGRRLLSPGVHGGP